MSFLKKLAKIFQIIEDSILIAFTSALIVISILQFVLTFLGHGILWFDPLLKYLVLWTGMLATSVTTSHNKHIKIDLVGYWTKGRVKTGLHVILNLFSVIICTTLFIISVIYLIKIEIPSTDPAPFLNIPNWILIIIVPITFGIIDVKFLIYTIKCVCYFIQNKEYKTEEESTQTTNTNVAQ